MKVNIKMQATVKEFFQKLTLPNPELHKGENGKLLIIGGSELFHAASKWSLDIASKFVDMVFYASVPDNNTLVWEAKRNFWNGIVIPRGEVESYIAEADAILIGPGMTREELTRDLTESLLMKHPKKRWVIDAGALQMVDPNLLNEHCIVTPHQKEMKWLEKQITREELIHKGVTIVLKGVVDTIYDQNLPENKITVMGGNAGMTKGGTGDVLAGLVAALYTTQPKLVAAVVASYTNKMAGDSLHETVGPYFNASDLVDEVPRVLWQLLSELE